jgi:hypothetical protein
VYLITPGLQTPAAIRQLASLTGASRVLLLLPILSMMPKALAPLKAFKKRKNGCADDTLKIS